MRKIKLFLIRRLEIVGRRFLFTVVICFYIMLPLLKEKTLAQNSDKYIVQFSRFLEDLRHELKIPGLSAAIVKDGTLLWAEGFGFSDLEKGIKATPETAYFLASLTKTFASTITLQLVEQGKLNLDDPIAKFSIHVHSPGVITVRHLLSHASEGIPGTFFRYNGDRFYFLNQIIQRAAGKSFRQLVIENILQPLHMEGTAPVMTGNSDEDGPFSPVYKNLTKPYSLEKNGRVGMGRYEKSFSASAGLISTVLDLAKYDRAINQNILLQPATQEIAFTPYISNSGESLPYGLGWFTQRFSSVRMVWHYGYYSPSESTFILRFPDDHLTLIVLANLDALSRPFELGDGDALNSPLAVVFFRMFVYPKLTSRELMTINWKSIPDTIISQIKGENDVLARELYKRELMSFWRVYRSSGEKEIYAGLQKVYGSLFSDKKLTTIQTKPAIAEISEVRDAEYQIVEFTLAQNTMVRIYSIGEGLRNGMYDYGGIEDVRAGKLVWVMDYKVTVDAGGSPSNRLVNTVIPLSPGIYRLHFKTDGLHSFERWTSFPPNHLFWGISLYEEKPAGMGSAAVVYSPAKIIPTKEITSSLRLLDPSSAEQRRESAMAPITRVILMICGLFFALGMVIWPVCAVVNFFKRRRSAAAKISNILPKRSRLSIVATCLAWINGVLGLIYIVTSVVRKALDHIYLNGFDDAQAAEIKLFFLFLPLLFAGLSVACAGFTIWMWAKRDRSPVGRWFYAFYTAACLGCLAVSGYFYWLLFV